MKKILSAFIAFSLLLFYSSCAPDSTSDNSSGGTADNTAESSSEEEIGGCSIKGIWKVSDVKIQTSTMSPGLLKTMQNDYGKSVYTFMADGKMSIQYAPHKVRELTYTYKGNSGGIKWKAAGSPVEESVNLVHCSTDSLKIEQILGAVKEGDDDSIVAVTLVPK